MGKAVIIHRFCVFLCQRLLLFAVAVVDVVFIVVVWRISGAKEKKKTIFFYFGNKSEIIKQALQLWKIATSELELMLEFFAS